MTSIVVDIGGTNARFAIARPEAGGYSLESLKVVDCRRFANFEEALGHWLDELAQPVPGNACVAAAGPVEKVEGGERVYMTNLGWTIKTAPLRAKFGFTRLDLINDFAALALSLPRLGEDDYTVLRDRPRLPGAAMAVIGPGTGLGVGGLAVDKSRYHILDGEGGHANLAAATARELQLLQILVRDSQPVYNEWVLSGRGLVNLYRAVCELNGRQAQDLTPPDVSARGLDNSDPMCREALLDFFNFLGNAGAARLILGARGGVFLGGGILPRIAALLPESEFEQRFLSKGKVESWMETVPLYALNAGYQALVGAAAQLED